MSDALRLVRATADWRARTKRHLRESILTAALNGASLVDIASAAGVSRQRIEQILDPAKAEARTAVTQALRRGPSSRIDISAAQRLRVWIARVKRPCADP